MPSRLPEHLKERWRLAHASAEEEKDSIREAKADWEAGKMENFVALEDLEKELGI